MSIVPLYPPSEEQKIIHSKIKSGQNVVVDAVAGSGKTTCILHIPNECKSEISLVLTYNAKLKDETRLRLAAAKISHLMEIHSYHSFGFKYYSNACCRDIGIRQVIENNQHPQRRLPIFGIIVLDEAQDITRELWLFFLKIYSDVPTSGRPPQIVLFGDRKQSIYKFKGSDERYLTLTELICANTGFRTQWSRLSLSTSFRVSGNMAAFVNRAMVKEQLIHATKSAGQPVQYLVGGPFKANYWIVDKVVELHRNGIAYDDMIVLAPSVKLSGKTPLNLLSQELSEMGIMLGVSNDFEDKAAAETNRGKLLFTTFHQAKGIERKVVIVYSFGVGYFDFYARDLDSNVCSNALYVACTRAKELLILVAEEFEGEHLPFLDRAGIESGLGGCVKVTNLAPSRYHIGRINPPTRAAVKEVPVTTMLQWLPEVLATQCRDMLTITAVRAANDESIELPATVSFGTHSEKVSDLNGLAIPAMLEWESKAVSMLSHLVAVTTKTLPKDKVDTSLLKYFTAFQERVPVLATTAHFLELACMYDAAVTGYTHKLKQIKHYDWLDEDDVSKCILFLKSLIPRPENASYEHQIAIIPEMYTSLQIAGIADILTDTTLFEIKCVKDLTSAHFIQLALYAWLWGKTHPTESRSFQLVNVTTGEVWAVSADQGTLEAIANKVIHHYLNPPSDAREDDKFVIETHAEVVRYTGGWWSDEIVPGSIDFDSDGSVKLSDKEVEEGVSGVREESAALPGMEPLEVESAGPFTISNVSAGTDSSQPYDEEPVAVEMEGPFSSCLSASSSSSSSGSSCSSSRNGGIDSNTASSVSKLSSSSMCPQSPPSAQVLSTLKSPTLTPLKRQLLPTVSTSRSNEFLMRVKEEEEEEEEEGVARKLSKHW